MEKLLCTQLLSAEEGRGCEAYGPPGFSSLLGEKHILDISEAGGEGCVTGKGTASNQPALGAVFCPGEGHCREVGKDALSGYLMRAVTLLCPCATFL